MPEPHRLIFNKDQLRNEGKQHTNHLVSASSFPGPEKEGREGEKPSPVSS